MEFSEVMAKKIIYPQNEGKSRGRRCEHSLLFFEYHQSNLNQSVSLSVW